MTGGGEDERDERIDDDLARQTDPDREAEFRDSGDADQRRPDPDPDPDDDDPADYLG